MIRLTTTEELSRTIVTIEGHLLADSIDIVEKCCNEAALPGKPVQVFLRDVTIVDQDGRLLLARLAAKGFRLVASGVYTSYIVQAITMAEPSGRNGRCAGVGAGKARIRT